MNNQNTNKLKLFLMGLENRFSEDCLIFKQINTTYTAGLKQFTGIGLYNNGNISYNFNGKTETFTINQLFDNIIKEVASYDCLSLIYSERGSSILITADNKNVTMKNIATNSINDEDIKDISSKNPSNNISAATSTLLNRDYYVKVGSANALLKEIGIMSKDGKIKNDKIRKYNQIDRYVELLDGVLDKLPRHEIINILDCGCGKSYLSFVLNYYLTEVKRRKCHFIGLDYAQAVINSSKDMAKNLSYRNMEFHAIDVKDYVPTKHIHVVLSLHACDTATDMALALGIKATSDVIIAVPCCHKELLTQYSYEPFKNILKQGILKTRMADILTDGMRSLMLEAKGYDVSVVEYISPLETPKNLMIRAVKTTTSNDKSMDDYISLMSSLNIYPALYSFLNEYEI